MVPPLSPLPASLDRENLLYVFVSGPGQGESIAVALPGRGWLVVDGCYVHVDGRDEYPALVAYERWKATADPVEALVWTHPHSDHYEGILQFIERYAPRRVGVVLAEQPAMGSIRLVAEAFARHPLLPVDVRLEDTFNTVKTTFESVVGRWEDDPSSVWLLRQGAPTVTVGATKIDVLFPTDAAIRGFFDGSSADTLRRKLRSRANELSAVIRLTFGATTILLGGDLPVTVNQGRTRLGHGWHDVANAWPAAGEHTAGKVPHHGSIEAVVTPVFGPSVANGAWVVTPFVKRRLPHPEDGSHGGLRVLLAQRPVVRLTADSGLLGGSHHGREVARAELRDRLASRTGSLNAGTSVASPASALDCTWGIALDASGRIRGLFAGPAALSVVEAAAQR